MSTAADRDTRLGVVFEDVDSVDDDGVGLYAVDADVVE